MAWNAVYCQSPQWQHSMHGIQSFQPRLLIWNMRLCQLPSMSLHKHPLGIYSTWHLSSAVTSRSSLCQMGHLVSFLKKPVKETTTVGHVYPLVTYLTTLSAKLILYVMVTKCCSLLNTCDCDGCLFSCSVSGGKRKGEASCENGKKKTIKDTTNTRV